MAEPPVITGHALPALLAEIAALTSVEVAIAIARAFGGRRLSLPREPKPDHPIVRVVGAKAAQLLCRQLGGMVHSVPSCRPLLHWHDARRLRAKGWSHARIAREIGIGENHVRRLLAGTGAVATTTTLADAPVVGACPSCGRRLVPRRAHACDPRQGDLFPTQ